MSPASRSRLLSISSCQTGMPLRAAASMSRISPSTARGESCSYRYSTPFAVKRTHSISNRPRVSVRAYSSSPSRIARAAASPTTPDFGAIRQHIALQDQGEAFYFVADYHALTTLGDALKADAEAAKDQKRKPRAAADILRENVRDVALDYLALGLDPKKATFYRQSDV